MKRLKRTAVCVVAAAIVLAVIVEVGARFSGLARFPLYQTDSEIGYIPAPNTSGCFLRKNDWLFNEKSMGVGPYRPNEKTDVLLLGDSIVYGGNPYRQADKLGPRLEQESGEKLDVWPIGAGSWAVPNQITYLERHRELFNDMEVLVWVVNSGDFGERTQWKSEFTHPKASPPLASIYLLKKYVLPRIGLAVDKVPQDEPPIGAVTELPSFDKEWESIRTTHPKLKRLVVWYPTREELKLGDGPVATLHGEIEKRGDAGEYQLVDLSKTAQWNAGWYKDGIHPTAEGFQVLAGILLRAIEGSPGSRLSEPSSREGK